MSRLGKPSTRYAHLGLHNVSLGPNPPDPALRGNGLRMVIYDRDDRIVREMVSEQITLKDGYVSFFESQCRPGVYTEHIYDVAPDGGRRLMHHDAKAIAADRDAWLAFVERWVSVHGVPQ